MWSKVIIDAGGGFIDALYCYTTVVMANTKYISTCHRKTDLYIAEQTYIYQIERDNDFYFDCVKLVKLRIRLLLYVCR